MRTAQMWFERQQCLGGVQKTIYFKVDITRVSTTQLNLRISHYEDSSKQKYVITNISNAKYTVALKNANGSTCIFNVTLSSTSSVTTATVTSANVAMGTIQSSGSYSVQSMHFYGIITWPYKDLGYESTYTSTMPKYGTLTLTAYSPYQSNAMLQAFYGSIGSAYTMASPYTQSTIVPTYSVPNDFMTQVLNNWTSSPRSQSVIFAYMKQSDPYGNPLKTVTVTALEMNNLLNGQNITKTMTNKQ